MLPGKKIIFINGALLIIVLAGFGVVYWKADDYISDELSKHVQKASHQQYSLTVDDMDISLFPLGLTASGLHFSSPDSVFLKTRSGNLLLSLKIKMLKAVKVNLFSLIFKQRLMVGRLEIKAPEISIISSRDSVDNIVWQEGKSNVAIELLNIEKGAFKWEQGSSFAKSGFDVNGADLSLAKQDLQLGSLFMMFTGIAYQTPDSLYRILCDSIVID